MGDVLLALKDNQENSNKLSHANFETKIESVINLIKEIQRECNKFSGKLTLPGYQAVFKRICDRWMLPEFRTSRTETSDSIYDGILISDAAVLTWLSSPQMFGPEQRRQPTQLETYANCPFRFFLERVAGIDPLPEVDSTLSSKNKGTLDHDILNKIYFQWYKNGYVRIKTRDFDETSSLLFRIAKESFEKHKYQSPVWHATVASLLGYNGLSGALERFFTV